ncbi:hypothetical protein vBPmiSPMCJR_029 [Proteus phage vB_PmiS_PM-CJR]|nr:hypothetical protein vBPmiSPMCJR_029 [Proteus phage vB_PmiS_PM-CJR]
MKHVHADLIMKYAEIAQRDSKPWTYFQELISGVWVNCQNHMCFYDELEYRLKPRTININGFEVPEPLRSIPPYDTEYFLIDFLTVNEFTWTNDDDEHHWLKAGLIHLTRENAEKHLEALLSFTKE